MAGSDEEPMDLEEEYVPEGGIRIGDIYIPPPPLPALTLDNSGPRLIITHIENEWFKSYAGMFVLSNPSSFITRTIPLKKICRQTSVGPLPQELHQHRGPQRKRQVERDRLDVVCFRIQGLQD